MAPVDEDDTDAAPGHTVHSVRIARGTATVVCECGWESDPVDDADEADAHEQHAQHAAG
jgi:hypothetical protein